MAYTETHTKWYGSRIWDSIKWTFIWILLIIGSIVLLWWNEWRTIDATKWLNEWQKITISWETSPVNKDLEWKLIHINGTATTDEVLNDETFFVNENALKLIRKVEMFQWKENSSSESKDNLWGSQTTTTTYTYEKVWDDSKISSANFKESGHTNPSEWLFESNKITWENIKVWDMKLSNPFISQINKETTIDLKEESFNNFLDKNDIETAKKINGYIYIWSNDTVTDTVTITDTNTGTVVTNTSTKTNAALEPKIWDLRISFSAVYPAEISAIWLQNTETLVSYTTKRNTKINLLQYGSVSIENMYEKAHSDNMFMAWILRAVWLLLMFIWFRMVFWLIIILAKIVPIISSILSAWVSIIAFVLTLIVWWGTIIIAWFFVRPLVSIILIILIAWTIYWIKKYSQNNKINLNQ